MATVHHHETGKFGQPGVISLAGRGSLKLQLGSALCIADL
jgi:hypothetical protein